jgi:erythromycin esterase-like protein
MDSTTRERLERLTQRGAGTPPADIVDLLRQYAERLPDLDSAAFGERFDRYGDARVVLIGEASHGTADFYRTRAAITRRLIEQHGFNLVAVEADWPDAGQLDRELRGLPPSAYKEPAFSRFPTWMWRNAEVAHFVRWLYRHNQAQALEQRVEFRGLDIYSLHSSMAEVLRYLEQVDTQLAQQARERYGCLRPWQDEPALYGHFVERSGLPSCEDAVVAQLSCLLAERLEQAVQDDEAFFNATQNARVVRHAAGAGHRGYLPPRNRTGQPLFRSRAGRAVRCLYLAGRHPSLARPRIAPIAGNGQPRRRHLSVRPLSRSHGHGVFAPRR